MRLLAVVPLLLAVGVVGCKDDKPAAKPIPSATAKPTASTAPAVKPKALDVASLKKALKCGGGGHGPCRVLAEMKDCTPWSNTSEDIRWLGEGYVVSKGAFVDEFTLMRARRVPTSEVSKGQLPMKFGMANIPDDRPAEKRHATKAIRAYKRSDVVRKPNVAMTYIADKSDWPEAFSMPAKENQVYVATGGGMYVCVRTDQRAIVVKRAGSREHAADGVYAVMWPASW